LLEMGSPELFDFAQAGLKSLFLHHLSLGLQA
jgi:hypothetical protein